LQAEGPRYTNNINEFYQDWIRIGAEELPKTDRDVWELLQDGTSYVIKTTAASVYPFAMPQNIVDAEPESHPHQGVYAAAILNFNGEVIHSYDLEDCEVEFELSVDKRTTGYAESGLGVHWNSSTGVMPFISNENGTENVLGDISQTPDLPDVFSEPGIYIDKANLELVSFYEYYRSHYRYLGVKVSPDKMEIFHHREGRPGDATAFFYGGTPWDCNHTVNPDSLHYTEGHNYEGEMAGAAMRFCQLVLNPNIFVEDPADKVEISTNFGAVAVDYAARICSNTISKWVNRSESYNSGSDLLRGASQSGNLIGFGNFDEGFIWRTTRARTGSMFLHSVNTPGIPSNIVDVSNIFLDDYIARLNDNIVVNYLGRNGILSFAWNDGDSWFSVYDNGVMDAGHAAPTIRHLFLDDVINHRSSTNDVAMIYADNFINILWNQKRDAECRIYEYRDGPILMDSKYDALDDYPLLAKYDFRIWEIFYDYYTEVYDCHTENLANGSAEMAYMVKYGTPKDAVSSALSLTNCPSDAGSAVIIRWCATTIIIPSRRQLEFPDFTVCVFLHFSCSTRLAGCSVQC
jgi:hypothetical protein